MLEQLTIHNKSIEVCMKTRSPSAPLSVEGQVTEQTTGKWSIRSNLVLFKFLLLTCFKTSAGCLLNYDSFIGIVRPSVRSFIPSFLRLLIRPFFCLFVRLFIRSFIRPSVRPSDRSFVRSFVRSLARSVCGPLIYFSVKLEAANYLQTVQLIYYQKGYHR